MEWAWFAVSIIAAENLADILTSVIDWPRCLAQKIIVTLRLGSPPDNGLFKITVCKYCQAFWFSSVFMGFLTFYPNPYLNFVVATLAAHRLAVIFGEFTDRWMNRAPFTMFANVSVSNPEPTSKDSEP